MCVCVCVFSKTSQPLAPPPPFPTPILPISHLVRLKVISNRTVCIRVCVYRCSYIVCTCERIMKNPDCFQSLLSPKLYITLCCACHTVCSHVYIFFLIFCRILFFPVCEFETRVTCRDCWSVSLPFYPKILVFFISFRRLGTLSF